MWGSIIAVVGTLLGATVAGIIQHRADRTARTAQTEDARRERVVTAITDLATAVSNHRRAMWALRDAQLTGQSEERVRALLDESHRTRADITGPAVQVRLLARSSDIRAAAHEAVQSTYRMRDAADLDVLETQRATALDAHDQFVEIAARSLESV